MINNPTNETPITQLINNSGANIILFPFFNKINQGINPVPDR